jgi:hypothetical protein
MKTKGVFTRVCCLTPSDSAATRSTSPPNYPFPMLKSCQSICVQVRSPSQHFVTSHFIFFTERVVIPMSSHHTGTSHCWLSPTACWTYSVATRGHVMTYWQRETVKCSPIWPVLTLKCFTQKTTRAGNALWGNKIIFIVRNAVSFTPLLTRDLRGFINVRMAIKFWVR